MPLSTTATETEVDTAFNANLPPFSSVDQATTFLQACVRKLSRPAASGTRNSNLQFEQENIRMLYKEARDWLASNSPDFAGNQSVYQRSHGDFTEFRG